MSNILLTRQSNLFWHIFNTLKQLQRSSGILPACLLSQCLRTDEVLFLRSSTRKKQMATGVYDITSIALVTLEVTHHPRIVDRELLGTIAARKHRLDSSLSFTLRSFNYIFTILADSWSLKGLTTRVVVSVVDLDRNMKTCQRPLNLGRL